jgi:hypothetical protein
VAVQSTSGRGTITDSAGRYSLTILTKDSIWFSMIGKNTMKYPVDTISNTSGFDVMIHIKASELPEVKVRNRYYKFDSLQNRKDYAKIFEFKKPGIRLSSSPTYNTTPGVSVGLDLTEFINMFRFKRTRQILALQRRLKQQEEDKYIDFRFKKFFVIKLTGLKSPQLDTFMNRYRPDYYLLQTFNDLEFGYYIQQCFEAFKKNQPNPYRFFTRPNEDEEE